MTQVERASIGRPEKCSLGGGVEEEKGGRAGKWSGEFGMGWYCEEYMGRFSIYAEWSVFGCVLVLRYCDINGCVSAGLGVWLVDGVANRKLEERFRILVLAEGDGVVCLKRGIS